MICTILLTGVSSECTVRLSLSTGTYFDSYCIFLLYVHRYRFKSVPPKKSVLTEPHAPVLVTAERSRKRKAQEMSGDTADANEKERSATTFHARPMPNFTKITVSRA